MNFLRLTLLISYFSFYAPLSAAASASEKELVLVIPQKISPRFRYGLDSLKRALLTVGYKIQTDSSGVIKAYKRRSLLVGKPSDFRRQWTDTVVGQKEGFHIKLHENSGYIHASDDSGILYGTLKLVETIRENGGALPNNFQCRDHPEMVLRGTAIGIQKTHYLPGRTVYEYPYTPAEFPWLYDKKQWVRYLDMLLENRYNSLYLWNGHPFASLVRLAEYPYAVEVDDDTFKKNEAIFRFITAEADKRGIWIIQMFYNIILSKPFAEKHQLKTQDRNRPIIPIIADYTRKSIAAFVEKYPNVGLLVTLGEAMEGVGQDDVDWFTKTIIPGVQDGLKRLGLTQEPPIVLRAHDTDAPQVMKAALPLYKNLYTMAKYNGEALTTYTPRGKWAELHRTLSKAAPVHIENVHILANLEPFRYGSPDFIQKSVQAMHQVYHANGLHLYPQASYWDWPYAADKIDDKGDKRLLQVDRDWLWYKAWARYAWKADRDKVAENDYWSGLFAEQFGINKEGGLALVKSYEEMGEIAPKLLRRYGITDGNRQTLSLGMFMTQLINPYRYGLFTLLYESEAPEGEMIIDYAKKEWNKEPHLGETPMQVADEVEEHGKKAVKWIDEVQGKVQHHQGEFQRIRNDMHCYQALANFYAEKARAAISVLRYKYSNDIADLQKALPYLERSVEHYRQLTTLTRKTYWYANSMQTTQRKIPIRGVDGRYKTWEELLPLYEEELAHFRQQIDSLKKNPRRADVAINQLHSVEVQLEDKGLAYYPLRKGAVPYTNQADTILDLAPDLMSLKGVRRKNLIDTLTSIRFSTAKPVKLLVGYFRQKDLAFGAERSANSYAPAPDLEHDASANDYGQSEVFIANAIALGNHPPVDIHSYSFDAGKHSLTLPKGQLLLLGFIDGTTELKNYDANIGVSPDERNIDWLFE
ncbi:hypothetical protein [Olivibacter sp. XZL3]|uniref:alpha-d-galacturonidase n=1 Tax=Olivibacter sp. XZL3 TaxID=1735116 RepID=UPI001065E894|nr:hypothetical protein [Olivibacter sp. XZL3]